MQTAIFSTPFCTAAANAFYLIARNLARVAAVTVLGDFILTVMTVSSLHPHTYSCGLVTPIGPWVSGEHLCSHCPFLISIHASQTVR